MRKQKGLGSEARKAITFIKLKLFARFFSGIYSVNIVPCLAAFILVLADLNYFGHRLFRRVIIDLQDTAIVVSIP